MYQPRHFPSCSFTPSFNLSCHHYTNRRLIVRDIIIHYSVVLYSIAVICSSNKIVASLPPPSLLRIDLFIKMCTICTKIIRNKIRPWKVETIVDQFTNLLFIRLICCWFSRYPFRFGLMNAYHTSASNIASVICSYTTSFQYQHTVEWTYCCF